MLVSGLLPGFEIFTESPGSLWGNRKDKINDGALLVLLLLVSGETVSDRKCSYPGKIERGDVPSRQNA